MNCPTLGFLGSFIVIYPTNGIGEEEHDIDATVIWSSIIMFHRFDELAT